MKEKSSLSNIQQILDILNNDYFLSLEKLANNLETPNSKAKLLVKYNGTGSFIDKVLNIYKFLELIKSKGLSSNEAIYVLKNIEFDIENDNYSLLDCINYLNLSEEVYSSIVEELLVSYHRNKLKNTIEE